MLDSSIIEVVIGLIFIFAFLAILVTQINTLLTNIMRIRSKQLKDGIVELIGDKRLQAEMLIHPLVRMVDTSDMMLLSLQVSDDMADEIIEMPPENVTWINPKTFVDALLGVLISRVQPVERIIDTMPKSDEQYQLKQSFRAFQNEMSVENLSNLERDLLAVSDADIRQQLIDAFNKIDDDDLLQSPISRSEDLIPLLNGIRSIATPAFRDALEMIVATAKDMDEARQKLLDWFDDGMGRTSARFKRLTVYINFAIAVVVVVLLNADSLAMARTLWEDDALRIQIATTAREFDTSTLDPALTTTATPEPVATDTGTDTTTPEEDLTLDDIVDQAQEDLTAIDETLQVLFDFNLPIGWVYVPVTDEMIITAQQLGMNDPRNNARNLWNFVPWHNGNWIGFWFLKALGLAATAIAAAQGAPFWFDLLGKLSRK